MAQTPYERISEDVAGMTMEEVVVWLSDVVKNQPNNEFARSINRAVSGGYGSSKQEFWARVIVSEKHPEFNGGGVSRPEPKTEAVDVSAIVELLDTAKENLKWPKIRLHGLSFSLAGERAKAPGTVNVTDGGPYGRNEWYGRIERDGTWTLSAKATPEIIERVKAFAADPAKVGGEHGHTHGECCFCGTALSDERSTHHGYGPTCAKNWKLPYLTQKAFDALAEAGEARKAPTGDDKVDRYEWRDNDERVWRALPGEWNDGEPVGDDLYTTEETEAMERECDPTPEFERVRWSAAEVAEQQSDFARERQHPEFNRGGGHYRPDSVDWNNHYRRVEAVTG